jgi:hypothetical protein
MRSTFPHPTRCVSLTIALLLALILAGRGQMAGPGPEPLEPASSLAGGPPESTLSFNEKTQTGGIGSFCWERG